jgi:O-antigen ligase
LLDIIHLGAIFLLADQGVLGLGLFVGLMSFAVYLGGRAYINDSSEIGAISGALACSVIAFAVYRLALSLQENHMLFFVIIAAMICLLEFRRSAIQNVASVAQTKLRAVAST